MGKMRRSTTVWLEMKGEGKNEGGRKEWLEEGRKNGTENEGRKKQIATKWDYRMRISLVLLLFPFLLFSSWISFFL